MEVNSSKPVSVAEAKDILSKRKENGELGYEQSQALENAERIAPDSGKVKTLISKIVKEGISEELAIKIIDIRPTNASSLRAILAKDKVEISEDGINQILKEL